MMLLSGGMLWNVDSRRVVNQVQACKLSVFLIKAVLRKVVMNSLLVKLATQVFLISKFSSKCKYNKPGATPMEVR